MNTPPESLRPPIVPTPFSMTVESVGGVGVLRLAGSCTMELAAQVGSRLVEVVARSPARTVVDMSALDFIESTGLGGLVSGYVRARKHGGEVALVAPQPAIRQLLLLTRLEQLFPVFDRMEEALSPS